MSGQIDSKPIQARPIEILLVEDNEDDVILTREALSDGKILNSLRVVRDGIEALSYLRKEGECAEAPTPDLLLLDLNLPRMDGRQVLEEIKKDPRTRRIPVVILTTSKADEDILRSYDLHANCYITKPVKFDQFVQVIRTIEKFWLSIVQLPTQANPSDICEA